MILTRQRTALLAGVWIFSILLTIYFSTSSVQSHETTPGGDVKVSGIGGTGQTSATASPVEQGDIYDWARANGAIVNVKMAKFQKGGHMVSGAEATKDIKVGDVVIAVPRKLIITPDVIKASPIGKVCRTLGDVTDEALFTLFVLWISAKPEEAGIWGAYGKVLRNTELLAPALKSEAEVAAMAEQNGLNLGRLQSAITDTMNVVPDLMKMTKNVLANPHQHYFTPEMLTEPQVRRAYMLFVSRYWRLDFPNGQGVVRRLPFMAPVADMLNMGPPGTTFSSYNANDFDGSGSFRMEAGVAVEKGKEVEFYYGGLCKEDLFNHYGFVTVHTKPC